MKSQTPVFWSLRERMPLRPNKQSSSFHHVRALAVLVHLLAMRSHFTQAFAMGEGEKKKKKA